MKSIQKADISFNSYHLPSSAVLDRKANTSTLSFFYKQLGSVSALNVAYIFIALGSKFIKFA